MRLRFDPLRFVGHLCLAYLGSSFAAAVTLLLARYLVPGSDSPASGSPIPLILSTMILLLPFLLPVILLLLLAAYLSRVFLPSIQPGSLRMILIWGTCGVLLEAAALLLTGIGERGDFGRHALLSASVGGGVAGVIVAGRIK